MIDQHTADNSGMGNAAIDTLAELWCEVLGITERPLSTDDFFSLGGDSMSMVMLEFRIKEQFSVELPASIILEAPTLHELANLIDEYRAAEFRTQISGQTSPQAEP